MLKWVDKLGYDCIINKIMKVKFWGTRGSIPSPGKNTVKYGGNTTCVEVTLTNGKVIIIDAGSGIRLMVDKIISEGIKEISLLLTHSHWDHIQGFPFFSPIFSDNFSINIYGASPTFERLLDILKGQMDFIYFPVQFEHIDANVNFKKIDNSGISIDNEENEVGGKCIAGPIKDSSGNVLAAFSISVPSTRLDDKRAESLKFHIKANSKQISQAIGYGGI